MWFEKEGTAATLRFFMTCPIDDDFSLSFLLSDSLIYRILCNIILRREKGRSEYLIPPSHRLHSRSAVQPAFRLLCALTLSHPSQVLVPPVEPDQTKPAAALLCCNTTTTSNLYLYTSSTTTANILTRITINSPALSGEQRPLLLTSSTGNLPSHPPALLHCTNHRPAQRPSD